MRPLLALEAPGDDLLQVADRINELLADDLEGVTVTLINTPDDLRAYEAGQLVLYRKPARRRGDRITYEDPATGEPVVLEQLRLGTD